eukprot:143474-Rhodomonas_salina.4
MKGALPTRKNPCRADWCQRVGCRGECAALASRAKPGSNVQTARSAVGPTARSRAASHTTLGTR